MLLFLGYFFPCCVLYFCLFDFKNIANGVAHEKRKGGFFDEVDLWPNPLKYLNNEFDEEDFDVDEDDEDHRFFDDLFVMGTRRRGQAKSPFPCEEEPRRPLSREEEKVEESQNCWCTTNPKLVVFTPRTSCVRPTDRFIDDAAETSRPWHRESAPASPPP
ncbi:hypothetical protein OPV22_011798 [Ensete ventricosum]|uniref:Uncharacterized protein n=1 Tax=Ensete ventricosum TaxID=4639 RepID=A0AAV8RKG4_ENSVE|nr:hypothetical protein OPV22_011798 [Ensete ventricosum]